MLRQAISALLSRENTVRALRPSAMGMPSSSGITPSSGRPAASMASSMVGVIPEDPDVPYCLNRGLVLREQNYYAARAYENIAKRIMGQKTPLMKI